jgi:Cu(I)/Ag(I) efflux system protein CusF
MKNALTHLAVAGALLAVSAFAAAQQASPMPAGMTSMQREVGATDAYGVGVVKAIDTATGSITLRHEAITSIGWPAMTMAFKVVAPELLTAAKIGDKVQFTLHPDGANHTVTSIKPMPK